MSTSFLRKTGAAASIALALSFGLAACGDDSDDAGTTPEAPVSSAADASAGTFGPDCDKIPSDPANAGSFNGMATEPVATAASGNPLLKTLVAAVGAAGLVDTLNTPDATFTVFAPVDTAFAAIQDTVDTLLKPANKPALSAVLTHHVLGERVAPADLQGEYTTVNKDKLTVSGNETDGFTVTDGVATAKVICGGITTDNATVYIIDSVLAGAKLPAKQ